MIGQVVFSNSNCTDFILPVLFIKRTPRTVPTVPYTRTIVNDVRNFNIGITNISQERDLLYDSSWKNHLLSHP